MSRLIYDDGCPFCRRWAGWARRWGKGVTLVPASTVDGSPIQAVVYVDDGGHSHRGAAACLRLLSEADRFPGLWRAYQNSPIFRWAADAVYRGVSRARPLLSPLTDFFLGPPAI